MPIQVIQRQQPRKPTFAEQIIPGIESGLKTYQELQGKQKKRDNFEKMGFDAAIADMPEQFQEYFINEAKANKSQNVDYTGQQGNQNQPQQQRPPREEFDNPYERKDLPQFETGGRRQGNNKSQQNPQQPEGNLLNPATESGKVKTLNFNEIVTEGKRIAQEKSANGEPTTVEEGINIANSLNNMKKTYNKEVEGETGTKIAQQREYGQKGVEKLEKVLQNPTDEQKSLFKRKGEEYAASNKSEAEIERLLSSDARQFKNTIANIKTSVGPRRIFTKLKEGLLGTSREAEKIRDDINLKLQPLLKEGLYDTSRNLLSELGYYAEEREGIITKLGEGANKAIAQLNGFEKFAPPDFSKFTYEQKKMPPEKLEAVKNNMLEVFKNDPGTNLILLRKAYEDKGINWDVFKDTINDLIQSGEIELTPDQFNMLDHLEKPPLDKLDKILHGLQLIGR